MQSADEEWDDEDWEDDDSSFFSGVSVAVSYTHLTLPTILLV